MPFGFYSSGTIILPPLPAWTGPRTTVSLAETFAVIARHSPQCRMTGQKDSLFVPVAVADLRAIIAWSLRLQEKIGGFKPEARDCDDFADAFDLAVSWMVRRAVIEAAPIVGCISVTAAHAWANIPAGGGHALNIVGTDQGLWVVEPQNGQACPLEFYPNRASIFAADGF
jgi:hypothetical protein